MGQQPNRQQRRDAARAERERRAAAAATRQRQRRALLAAVAVTATAVVAIAVALGSSSDGDRARGDVPASPHGAHAPAAAALLDGIPQDGTLLGQPDAPVTLVEFADLQCPFCGQFAVDAIPGLVRDYVRPGKVKLELRLLTFLGAESMRAAQLASAAALQGLGWQYADLFFNNQGQEGSGYVTEDFLREIGDGVDGLDVDRAFEQSTGSEADALIKRAAAAAETLGVSSTPSFFVRRGGGRLEEVQVSELSAEAIGAKLDELLAGDR